MFFYIVGRKLSAETMTSITRDLERVVSKDESEAFEKELEQSKESEIAYEVEKERGE